MKRIGLSRLKSLESVEPVLRYERAAPGELLHIDTKRLGRIHGAGHRITGDRTKNHNRGIGWDAVHLVIDDHSRVSFARVLADEGNQRRFSGELPLKDAQAPAVTEGRSTLDDPLPTRICAIDCPKAAAPADSKRCSPTSISFNRDARLSGWTWRVANPRAIRGDFRKELLLSTSHTALRISGSGPSCRTRRMSNRMILVSCTVKYRSKIIGCDTRGVSKFPVISALRMITS